MGNDATLSDLRVAALDFADMTGSSFPVTSRVNGYLNAGLRELHDIFANSDQDWRRKVHSYTMTGGVEEYPLPQDFFQVLGAYYIVGDRQYDVRRFERKEISGYVRGALTAGELLLEYYPQFEPLILDTDTVADEIPVAWEEWVAMYAAARLLGREESSNSWLNGELMRKRDIFVDMAAPRDRENQGRSQDVYHRFSPHNWLYAEHRNLAYRVMGDNLHILEIESRGA